MNQALEELIKNGAQYYTPARTVELAAGETKTLTFKGLNSRAYGVNRFIIGGLGLTDVTATAQLNKGKKETIFEDIQLATLRNLFLDRSLRGVFTIDAGTDMNIILTNNGGTARTVNVQLNGYDDQHLQKKQEDYSSRGFTFPEPEFVFVSDEIPAATTSKRISVPLPSYPLRLYRIATSSDSPENLMLSIRQDQVRIKPEVFISQVNDEFANMDIILPQNLKASVPFEIFVRNLDEENDHSFSFLAETYKI